MTRSQKLISTLILLAGIGPFGRAAFAAADSTADTAPADHSVTTAAVAQPAGAPVVDAAVAAPTADTVPAAPAPTSPPTPESTPAEPTTPTTEAPAPTTDPSADESSAADESAEATEATAEVESAATDTPATPAALTPAADTSYSGAAAEFLAVTNASRAAVGVAPLVANAELSAYAAQHAATMAGANHLHHSDISVLLGSWSTVGENVGVGPSVGAIHAALLASPGHYRNLSDAGFTHVGIGVYVDGGGRTWTAHVFGA